MCIKRNAAKQATTNEVTRFIETDSGRREAYIRGLSDGPYLIIEMKTTNVDYFNSNHHIIVVDLLENLIHQKSIMLMPFMWIWNDKTFICNIRSSIGKSELFQSFNSIGNLWLRPNY